MQKHLWKYSHFAFSVTLTVEMFINGMFWFGMYPFALITLWGQNNIGDVLVTIFEHAVPLLLLVVDLHMNYVIIWNYSYMVFHYVFLVVYLMINIWHTLNVRAVYPMITYKNALTYVFLIICALVVPVCHFIAIHYCRRFKRRKIQEIQEENKSQPQSQIGMKEAYEQVIGKDSAKSIESLP